MSLNTAHINGGVLIHSEECILLFCDNIIMEFHGQEQEEFIGTKRGRLYLTSHRMIYNAKDLKEKMQSFSFPFVTLSEVELEQPMFGANYIKGKCRAQPNGKWIGECKFKLHFKSGGAIEFGRAMLKAAAMVQRDGPASDPPPPYQAPLEWYAAPQSAYHAPRNGYYGWRPPTNVFPDVPPADSVYMTNAPPPYPGISAPYQGAGYVDAGQGAWGGAAEPAAWGGAAQPAAWPTSPHQNGTLAWANPSYNGQPMSQAGAYTGYGQPNYNTYVQNPPPYTRYPQGGAYAQPGLYPQPPYNPYPY